MKENKKAKKFETVGSLNGMDLMLSEIPKWLDFGEDNMKPLRVAVSVRVLSEE